MIPRKEAQRMLAEFIAALEKAEAEKGEALDEVELRALARELTAASDLVLRGVENVEQKGRRYLTEGRLTVTSVAVQGGLIVAQVRGTDETHTLGYDPTKNQWRCTCRAGRKGRCSHLIALKLVTEKPTTTGGTT